MYAHTHTYRTKHGTEITHSIFNALDFISNWAFIKRSGNSNLKTNRHLVC